MAFDFEVRERQLAEKRAEDERRGPTEQKELQRLADDLAESLVRFVGARTIYVSKDPTGVSLTERASSRSLVIIVKAEDRFLVSLQGPNLPGADFKPALKDEMMDAIITFVRSVA